MSELLSSTLIVEAAIFIAVSCAALLLLSRFHHRETRVDDRFDDWLRSLDAAGATAGLRGSTHQILRHIIQSPRLSDATAHLVPNDAETRTRLQYRLIKAGLYGTSALTTFLTVKLALMVLPPLVGVMLGWSGIVDLPRGSLFGALAGLTGMVLPGLWLDRRTLTRQRTLRKSLADFLDLLVACTETGMSIQASLKRVVEELDTAHPALAFELGLVDREIELGAKTEVALEHLADRTDLDDLRSLSTFVVQSQRFGATLADAMRDLADMLRYQREQRAEEQAQKATVKILLPTLIFIFPAVFVVLAGPAVIQLQAHFATQETTPAKTPSSALSERRAASR